MNKNFKTICSYLRTHLGVLVNNRTLMLSMPHNKCQELVKILLTTWKISHTIFALREASFLLGLVSNLKITTQCFKCAYIVLHHAASIALKLKSNAVFESGKCKHLIDILRHKNIDMKNFCLSKSKKKQCGSIKINIKLQSLCGKISTFSIA